MRTRGDARGTRRARTACRNAGAWLALACAAAVPAARAATDQPEGFELILLDGYEDCGLAYRDLDADTYGGDSDVRIQCPPLPAGYVAIGGDCNDANPLINPGATEAAPDAQFIDENCDGVDGNVAAAVFVVPGGSTAAGCGTRELPCSIIVAPARAQSLGRTQLYLGAGNHVGMPALNGFTNGLALHGGYDTNWNRAPRAQNLSRIEGGFVPQVGTVGATFVSGSFVLDELEVAAPTASVTLPDGSGASSYGVRVLAGAALSITRSSIVAGAGFPGLNGSNGASASQTAPPTAGAGGDGDQFFTICNDSSRGTRGSAGTNPTCPVGRSTLGGQGGLGGLMDMSCSGIGGTCFGSDCNATGGSSGLNAAFTLGGAFGFGGPGGPPCGGSSGADPGAVADGAGGAGGSNSRGGLVLGSAARWQGFAGNAGTLGENGGGGGGGGGAGGCDTGTNSYGDGGGGGGAGGCRATQQGGGGRPGGASIAVLAVQATSLAISNSTVVALGGGDGGFGGLGGTGQPGGAGGLGGDGPGGANGGNGGNGGRGGHAGGGGGGAGGVSVGVLSYQVSPTLSNLVPQIGAPGQGGGGGGGPVAGLNGTSGAALTTLSCAAPAGC